VIVDDDVAVDVMVREPGGDLLSPAGARQVARGLIQNTAGEPLGLQHFLQLGDGLAVPPGGRNDDIGSAGRHDLVQYPNARGVQVPVPIPPADRSQHAVDVEKDYPSRHSPSRCARSIVHVHACNVSALVTASHARDDRRMKNLEPPRTAPST
jgi:hypothetical protein